MRLWIAAIFAVLLVLPFAVGQEHAANEKLHVPLVGPGQPGHMSALSIERGVEYPSIVRMKGDVEIKWKNMHLRADEATYNERTGEIKASGNVRIVPYPQQEPGAR